MLGEMGRFELKPIFARGFLLSLCGIKQRDIFMNKQKLNELVNCGEVLLFNNKPDFIYFLKEIKSFGGKWLNVEEIEIPKKSDVQSYFRV